MALYSDYSNVASGTTASNFPYSNMLFVLQSDALTPQTDDTDISTWANPVNSNPAAPDEAVGPSPNAGVNKMRYRTAASGSAINGLPVVQGGASRGMGFNIDATKTVRANSSWTFYWAGRMPALGAQTTDGHLWGDYQGPLGPTSLTDGQFIARLIMHAGASDVLGYSYDVQNDSGSPTTQTTTDNLAGAQVLVFVFDKSIPSCKIYRNKELIFTGTWSTGGGTWDITDDFVELFQSGDGSPDQSFYGDTTDFWAATSAHDSTTRGTIEDILIARLGLVAPAAPTVLDATTVSSSQIDLTWTDNASTEDGFYIYQSTDNVTFTLVGTNAANDTTYSATGLSASTLYYFKVRAFKGTMRSAYTNTDSDTTSSASTSPYSVASQMWLFEADQITPQVDNTDLTTWPDGSTTPANGNNIVFPAASDPGGTKPKYRTSRFGSLPAIQSRSGDEGEITAMNPTLTSTSATMYFVLDYQLTDQPDTNVALVYPLDVVFFLGGHYIAPNIAGDNFSANRIEIEEDSSQYNLAAGVNGKQLLTFIFNKAAGTATVRRNGVQIGTVSGLGTEGWKFEGFITWLSVIGGAFSRYVGYLGASYAFSAVHSGATLTGIEGWIMSKWGLP
jgi:hypothetical protein